MKRLLPALCLLLLPSTAHASSRPSIRPYWVFFSNYRVINCDLSGKPGKPELERPSVDLTEHARARRQRALKRRGDPVISMTDGAPDPTYVSYVASTGASIRTRSRFLNAVSVDATNLQIAAIQRLGMVREVVSLQQLERDTASQADPGHVAAAYRQIEMLGIPEAHARGFLGQGVLICVLDSGFDLRHDSIRHIKVIEQRDFLEGDDDVSFDPSQDLPKQAYHGTQVLSVLAADIPGELVGAAPEAMFLLGKTEDIGHESQIEEDKWVQAVEWAEERGADILVSSLTYRSWYKPQELDGRTAVITRAANRAFDYGMLIVNSMGNYGPKERSLSPPADAPGVIAVGSVDENGQISPFSSLGPTWDGRLKPDLVAMGSGTRIAAAGTRDQYANGNGTSYSNPLVAGCAAILLSAHPDWGPEAVREALQMTASRVAQPDARYGWGIPNVDAALDYPAIEGIVRDMHTGLPIPNAVVRWEPNPVASPLMGRKQPYIGVAPTDSPRSGMAVADLGGAYVIPNLPDGTYVITAGSAGYFESVSEPLEVPPGLGDVDFKLRYRGE